MTSHIMQQQEEKSRSPQKVMSSEYLGKQNEKKRRVLIISNVLPVVFGKSLNPEWHRGWKGVLFRNLSGSNDIYEMQYIGCPQIYVTKDNEAEVEARLEKLNCLPVFLDPKVAHNHYQGFCRGLLWPVFHNIIDVYNTECIPFSEEKNIPKVASKISEEWNAPRSWNPASQELCWPEYCEANRQFAMRIIEAFHGDDIVWIQDYHLLMVPSYLRRKLHFQVNIGIFLHTPFPSSEIFRSLSMREEILRAMLCADHIGFLSFEYARHFLTCCKRMLGLSFQSRPGGLLGVEYNGRHVLITCSHMGMASSDIQVVPNNIQFKDIFDVKGIPEDCSIIAAVDSLEMLSGITLKLVAFERFLSMFPHKVPNVVLAIIGISLDSRPNDYNQCREEVKRMIELINRKWGKIVLFEERDGVTCKERMAIWIKTDVYLSTAVREGLNLKPFEYIVSRKEKPGVVILSEFCSCSRVLNGSLRINPWKISEVSEQIANALAMSESERIGRSEIDIDFLSSHSIRIWADRMLQDIVIACKRDTALTYLDVGFGFGFRVMNLRANFTKLDTEAVMKQYRHTHRRVLLFDYGGTLSTTESIDRYMHKTSRGLLRNVDGHARTPISEEVREYLRVLCEDPCNILFVMSNANRYVMEKEFGNIQNLGLISDNGFFYRKSNRLDWECFLSDSPTKMWLEIAEGLMKMYEERTNGAFVVKTEICITYDYRDADPEFGELQANELSDNLTGVLKNFKVEISRGSGYVEVHASGVNKSTAVTIALQYCSKKDAPDFVLCIGDDTSDELAFNSVKNFGEKLGDKCAYFTCTLGKKPSVAQYYVDSVGDVTSLLESLWNRSYRKLHRCDSLDLQEVDKEDNFQLEVLTDKDPMITRVASGLTLEELARNMSKENLYLNAGLGEGYHAKEEEKSTVVSWKNYATLAFLGIYAVWKLRHQFTKGLN